MVDRLESPVEDKMAIIITITCVLFISVGVQASDKIYGLMKIEENETSINYHIFGNTKEKTMDAYDTHNRLVAYSSGQNATFFIFNYETSEAVYFPDAIRYKNPEDFYDYIKKNTLKELYYQRRAKGYLCRPTTIPPGFSKHLTDILKHVIDDFSSECQAFSTVLWLAKITSITFLSSLSGIENLIGEIFVESPIDLESLVGMYQGFGDFFQCFDGGMKFLLEKRFKFDVGKIIQDASQSGFYVFVDLLEGLSSYLKKLDSFSDCVNDQYSFLKLIRKLGGDKNGGGDKNQLNSFIYTIVDVMAVIKRELSLDNLRATLKVYYETGSRGGDIDIEKQWRKAVKNLLESIKKFKLEKKLKNVVKLLQDILDETWKFKGVDMSLICKFLFALQEANDDTSFENKLKSFLEELDKKIH